MRYAVAIILLAILWQFVPNILGTPTFVFPDLASVLARLITDWDAFLYSTVVSSQAILISLVVATIIGTVLAYAVHWSKLVRALVEPIILISQVVPRVALVPLILIWFSYGLQSKIIVAVLICFFPVYEGLRSGLDSVSPELLMRAKLQGYSRLWIIVYLRTPFAVPSFFQGLKTASLFAVVGVVVAEFLASGDGVGIMIVERMGRGDTPAAFAYMLLISIVGVLLYAGVILSERSARIRLRL